MWHTGTRVIAAVQVVAFAAAVMMAPLGNDGGGIASAGTGPSPASGLPAPNAGSGYLISERIEVGHLPREALVYVPPGLPQSGLVPVIFFFHGGGSDAWAASQVYGFNREADQGFIAVYPNGSPVLPMRGRYWNEGNLRRADLLPDDVHFFDSLLDALLITYPMDPNSVFLAGQSNGGGVAYRIACERSERVAAIAVSAPTFFAPECTPRTPVSILHIHGTVDPTIPFAGVRDRRGTAPSVPEAITLWRAEDQCTSGPVHDMLNEFVELERHSACEGATEVLLYTVRGGGHCWPGIERGNERTCPPGGPHMSFSATSVATDFLLAHPRP